jgi:hypothetical protein
MPCVAPCFSCACAVAAPPLSPLRHSTALMRLLALVVTCSTKHIMVQWFTHALDGNAAGNSVRPQRAHAYAACTHQDGTELYWGCLFIEACVSGVKS